MSASGSRKKAGGGERLILGAALAVSLGMVWLATREVLVFAAFAGGLIALVVPSPLDQIVRWLLAGTSLGDLWTRDPQRSPIVEIPIAAQWPAARRQDRAQGGRQRHERLQKMRT